MTSPRQQTPPSRPRPQFRSVRVSRVQRLTPRFVRVTFTGEELSGFATHGPAEHVRLFFPPQQDERLAPPEWGPEGPIWPAGQGRPLSRVYTPRRWDAQALELDVEFILHGEGPGSAWAAGARPGNAALLTGPGGAYQLDPQAAWYLLAADDVALPALCTILEALPASTPAFVYAEVGDAAEERDPRTAARMQLTWLHRDPDAGLPGRALERALRAAPLPEGDGRVWVACEATVMRDIRRHLLYERNLGREAVHTHGYWKRGAADHPDHDLGQDV